MHIQHNVITKYNPKLKHNPNHKKILIVGPETLTCKKSNPPKKKQIATIVLGLAFLG